MGFLSTLTRVMSNLSGCHTSHFTGIPLQLCWHMQWQLCSPCWPEPGTGMEEGRAGSIVPAHHTCSTDLSGIKASQEASSNLPLSAEHQHWGGNPAYFCSVEFTLAPSAFQVPCTVLAELPHLACCSANGGTKAYQVYNGRSIFCLLSMFHIHPTLPSLQCQHKHFREPGLMRS